MLRRGALSLVACWWLAACGAAPASSSRVVVLGIDGLEAHALKRYARDLPNLTQLLDEGVYAEMTVTTPIMSPILWTTMASGYPVEAHGIGGWTNGQGRSFSGADVRVARVWDALSAEGRRSLVSGWLMTWPASIVRGALLSDRFVWAQPMSREGAAERSEEALDGTAYPDSLAVRAQALVPDSAWLAASPLAYQIEAYGAPSHPLRRDELHVRVFEALWPEAEADFGALYVNGADQVSHLYWPFSDPDSQKQIRADTGAHKRQVEAFFLAHPGRATPPWGEAGLTAVELPEAARWVPDYYAYLDEVVGRVRRVVGPDTTLIVVSDHGFQSSTTWPLIEGQHRGVAVFAAVGPRVIPGTGARIHVFDVAPTIYALLGMPAADDMPGEVRTDLFKVVELPRVATRTLGRGDIAVGSGTGAGDEALKGQLQALGYLDEDGRPKTAIGQSRSEGGATPP